MSLPKMVAKPTRFIMIAVAATLAVLIELSMLSPHWVVLIFCISIGLVLPLFMFGEELRKQIERAFASIYFRYRFGIEPPRDKKDWVAMKITQQVVDNVLQSMRSEQRKLKDNAAQLTGIALTASFEQGGSLVLKNPTPSEAQKVIRGYHRQRVEMDSSQKENAAELVALEKNMENSELIAKYFSFNV